MSEKQAIAARRRMRIQRLGTQMLALLKLYVADDPCAWGDPRFTEAKRLIALAESEAANG